MALEDRRRLSEQRAALLIQSIATATAPRPELQAITVGLGHEGILVAALGAQSC